MAHEFLMKIRRVSRRRCPPVARMYVKSIDEVVCFVNNNWAIEANIIWHEGIGWLAISLALVVAAVYVQGWRRLVAVDSITTGLPTRLARLSFAVGLLLLGVVLLAPVNALAHHYFFIHVVQQLLLVAWVPGLLMAANPLPVLWQGLPAAWQHVLLDWVQRHREGMRQWQWALAPGTVYVLFTAVYWLWYDPTLHQAMLQYTWLWYLEKVSLLGTALLYWWHVTEALPRFHATLPPIVRVLYVLIGAWPIKLTGAILLFTGASMYAYPEQQSMLLGLDLTANNVGSMIVWTLGGIFYTSTAMLLLRRWLSIEEEKPPLPISHWATREAMRAPGLD